MSVTIRCKCGKNEHVFQRLTLEDFPEGLVDDCCLEAIPTLAAASMLAPTLPPTLLAPKKRKRRGRKPNGKR